MLGSRYPCTLCGWVGVILTLTPLYHGNMYMFKVRVVSAVPTLLRGLVTWVTKLHLVPHYHPGRF